ncbi:7794_t:CDS:10 [Acaulospora morrowiae]|uniref:7794_t:CDS:1 n=1 Tax=Acaulospora morrowiae TaxID=94023 RepID=A0A9N8W2G2_9GLOM|nr:7794_t:CDS:10 [Acaulospora morrowiae]
MDSSRGVGISHTNMIRKIIDSILGYETVKIAKIKSRKLGTLYRVFQLAILAYIVYTLIFNDGYLKKELPVPGAVRITLQAPTTLTRPTYCTSGSLPCVYWGANDIQYPSDGAGVAFLTTRVSVTNYQLPQGCSSFLNISDPSDRCFFNPKSPSIPPNVLLPKSYIGDIEDYTIMVEHSIRGQATSIAQRNGLMDGALMSSNGKTMKSNPNADGDIFTVQEILTAANANLDGLSTAPGADKANGETYRSSGIVIAIVIEYMNVRFRRDEIIYKYLPQVIDGNEYKAAQNELNSDGSYTIIDRHGIRLVFQQHGSIGQFDFITFLTNIVGALFLLKFAERQSYADAKYEIAHPDENIKPPVNQGHPPGPINHVDNLARPEVGNYQNQPMANNYHAPPNNVNGNQQYYYYP